MNVEYFGIVVGGGNVIASFLFLLTHFVSNMLKWHNKSIKRSFETPRPLYKPGNVVINGNIYIIFRISLWTHAQQQSIVITLQDFISNDFSSINKSKWEFLLTNRLFSSLFWNYQKNVMVLTGHRFVY